MVKRSSNSLIPVISLIENGTIDFNEFLILISRIAKDVNNTPDLTQAFKVFDKDGNGFISPAELK